MNYETKIDKTGKSLAVPSAKTRGRRPSISVRRKGWAFATKPTDFQRKWGSAGITCQRMPQLRRNQQAPCEAHGAPGLTQEKRDSGQPCAFRDKRRRPHASSSGIKEERSQAHHESSVTVTQQPKSSATINENYRKSASRTKGQASLRNISKYNGATRKEKYMDMWEFPQENRLGVAPTKHKDIALPTE